MSLSEPMEGIGQIILHDKTCSNHFEKAIDKARQEFVGERIKDVEARREMLTFKEKNTSNSGLKMSQNAQEEAIELRGKVNKLKNHLEDLKGIVVNSLITVDWILKVGLAVGLWFFPVVQDRFIQAVGLAVYVLLLTVVSKAIIKAKSYTIEI